jgi:hypothetical protein
VQKRDVLFLQTPIKYVHAAVAILFYIIAYRLKARTVEPDEKLLLGNGFVTDKNGVTVGSGVFRAVLADVI